MAAAKDAEQQIISGRIDVTALSSH